MLTTTANADLLRAGTSTWHRRAGEIGNEVSFNASVGHSDFSDGNGSYNDWTIGISRAVRPGQRRLGYFDTDMAGGMTADVRWC